MVEIRKRDPPSAEPELSRLFESKEVFKERKRQQKSNRISRHKLETRQGLSRKSPAKDVKQILVLHDSNWFFFKRIFKNFGCQYQNCLATNETRLANEQVANFYLGILPLSEISFPADSVFVPVKAKVTFNGRSVRNELK